MMKKALAWLSFVVLAGCLMGAAYDKVVAVVNQEAILQSELDAFVTRSSAQLARAGKSITPEQLREGVLEALIIQKIQLQLAKARKIQVDDNVVHKALTNIAEQNHLSLDKLKTAVVREGITFADLKQRVHEDLIIRRLHQATLSERLQLSMSDDLRTLNPTDYESRMNEELAVWLKEIRKEAFVEIKS